MSSSFQEKRKIYDEKRRKKHPEIIKIYSKINNDVRLGKLKRENCEICNKPNAWVHHDDYSKPEQIRWFCQSCHCKYHWKKRKK